MSGLKRPAKQVRGIIPVDFDFNSFNLDVEKKFGEKNFI
jgi:hypothetical protein